jgi:hypothetical protein
MPKIAFRLIAVFLLSVASISSHAEEPIWISIGIPQRVHQGTDGTFYLNGTAPTSCNGVVPDYFRVNTNAPHWKEFYALILYAAANGKSLDCVVQNGCGTSQVWVKYCRVELR